MASPLSDLSRPVAIVFDLDGTLVDTVETRIRVWLDVFNEEEIPAHRDQVATLIGSDGRRLAREVATAAGVTLDDGRAEAIDARCGDLFAALNRHPRVLPGVTPLLARLEEDGMPWAIATSSRREEVAASVDALQLARPPLIVDGTHVAHAKPAPDLLLLAAKELNADPEACWYVGDSTWDVKASLAAGMVPIGVTTGAADAETLRTAGAREVVASLVELEV